MCDVCIQYNTELHSATFHRCKPIFARTHKDMKGADELSATAREQKRYLDFLATKHRQELIQSLLPVQLILIAGHLQVDVLQ